jgi:hypothetical protein
VAVSNEFSHSAKPLVLIIVKRMAFDDKTQAIAGCVQVWGRRRWKEFQTLSRAGHIVTDPS